MSISSSGSFAAGMADYYAYMLGGDRKFSIAPASVIPGWSPLPNETYMQTAKRVSGIFEAGWQPNEQGLISLYNSARNLLQVMELRPTGEFTVYVNTFTAALVDLLGDLDPADNLRHPCFPYLFGMKLDIWEGDVQNRRVAILDPATDLLYLDRCPID